MTVLTTTAPAYTREAWLLDAANALRPLFEALGEEVPALRVSVGWPGGRGKKGNVIGQCWSKSSSTDEVAALFISPVMVEPVEILAVLAHEIVHAIDDCQSGHRGRFAKIAKGLGLEGPMTATTAGAELKETLEDIANDLGEFPHAAMTGGGTGSGPKKQGTRMLKVECPDDGYVVRTTAKWLAMGTPTCPCGATMEASA